MTIELQQLLARDGLPPAEIAEKSRYIYETVLKSSNDIETGNFTRLHASDVQRMFRLYDELFLEGECKRALGDAPIHFNRLPQPTTRHHRAATGSFPLRGSGGIAPAPVHRLSGHLLCLRASEPSAGPHQS